MGRTAREKCHQSPAALLVGLFFVGFFWGEGLGEGAFLGFFGGVVGVFFVFWGVGVIGVFFVFWGEVFLVRFFLFIFVAIVFIF